MCFVGPFKVCERVGLLLFDKPLWLKVQITRSAQWARTRLRWLWWSSFLSVIFIWHFNTCDMFWCILPPSSWPPLRLSLYLRLWWGRRICQVIKKKQQPFKSVWDEKKKTINKCLLFPFWSCFFFCCNETFTFVAPSDAADWWPGCGGGAVPPAEPSRAAQDADDGHRHPGGRAGGAGERARHAARHRRLAAQRTAQGLWEGHAHERDVQHGSKMRRRQKFVGLLEGTLKRNQILYENINRLGPSSLDCLH